MDVELRMVCNVSTPRCAAHDGQMADLSDEIRSSDEQHRQICQEANRSNGKR